MPRLQGKTKVEKLFLRIFVTFVLTTLWQNLPMHDI